MKTTEVTGSAPMFEGYEKPEFRQVEDADKADDELRRLNPWGSLDRHRITLDTWQLLYRPTPEPEPKPEPRMWESEVRVRDGYYRFEAPPWANDVPKFVLLHAAITLGFVEALFIHPESGVQKGLSTLLPVWMDSRGGAWF